ncbi:carboxypeptidase-like regulatory domain-containing protein [Dyadobacter flavalbus]|uniref:Carboxypeptidase-like regulatory domain-containing protein n=2 Tax=Dyadobacter flavalbus TaxID=2579942 RepID=A0A5M8QG21_9BACT|nr:carboxypeptidase-like regulatory domain-containing protein [Dyadobacter flavalbus]
MKTIIKPVWSKMLLMICLVQIYSGTAIAQSTTIKGTVTDAKSGETLPYVSILIPGTTMGTVSDADGRYALTLVENHAKVKFTYIGYLSVEKEIKPGVSQVIDVKMAVDASMLKEVTVKGKAKYRNRDNPAVQLIREVIAHKDQNKMASNNYVEYEQYEKISFALSNLSESFREKRIFKNYQFLFKDQDSAAIGGKNMLPAYIQEKLSQVYFRKNPYTKKQLVLANRRAEFDAKFVDNDGLSAYFNRLYEDINLYDNDISIATNLLLSPIANTAPTFYKFFIRDTVKTNTPWLVELGFVPRNKTDMLFEGKLYVTLDGNYGVQNAYLTVNKDINLNFMRDLEAHIEFEKGADGRYHLNKTSLAMEFALGEKNAGFYGQRIVNFKNYVINQSRPDSIYKGPGEEIAYNPQVRTGESFWNSARHIPLDKMELDIYKNIDTLQTIPSFRRTMDISTLLLSGYKSLGKVEIGPVNTFYSFNPIEGFRLRFGGRTTTDLSKRVYFETYAAYGFKDEKWKYFLSGTYSFNNKSVYHFPLNYIRASYQRDTKIPGQDLQFVQEDNFLLSFKRGENNRWLYNDVYKMEYVRELENHFSYRIGFTQWRQTPAGILRYERLNDEGGLQNAGTLSNTEANLELRYAPNEQFYQGKLYRTPIINKYPIFTLRYNAGLKGVFEGQNRYHNVSANISKRVYLSQFGYADVTTEGGYIFGSKILFPLLTIHRANQTYAYQLNSYNLMNFLEFVSDHYASLDVQYYMNGFLFNKIPLIKKLKLREVFSFKGLMGGLRDENNPAMNPSLYRFPMDENGKPITYTLSREPYIEGSIGIANIFKLLRVDLVKRFTYLDNPNVSEWGVRARFRLDF